ncbi:hypothetical protein ACOMHN_042207 [Nucella lapillus]
MVDVSNHDVCTVDVSNHDVCMVDVCSIVDVSSHGHVRKVDVSNHDICSHLSITSARISQQKVTRLLPADGAKEISQQIQTPSPVQSRSCSLLDMKPTTTHTDDQRAPFSSYDVSFPCDVSSAYDVISQS